MHTQSKTKLLVAPVGLDRAEEELRAVGVGAGVGHREDAGALVLELEVLVLELVAVDGLPARSVLVRKIPSLAHEARNDSVKRRRFVPESGFAGAQLTEVFRRFRARVRSELFVFFIRIIIGVVVVIGGCREARGAGEYRTCASNESSRQFI